MALRTALAGFQLRRVKRTLLLLASLAVLSDAASAHTLRGKKVNLPACEGQKIGILDIGSFAAANKFPTCHYDAMIVNSMDGTIYLEKEREGLEERTQVGGHELGSHAAPWYLMEAIKTSKYYTEDLNDADIIYVNDYCYYIWWLATVHSEGRALKKTPGDYLMTGYKAMMRTKRWQANEGQEYVFYDSHPGFAAGNAARPYSQAKCFEMRKSTHLVMDTMMRYICGSGWAYNKLFITPYNPNRLDLSEPAAHLKQPFITLANRSLLAYHRSACSPLKEKPDGYNAGKMIRQYLAKIFVKEQQDVQVKCTNDDHTTALGGGKAFEFSRMYEHMQRTVFCLVLPGDAASTRRFSEIMTAGCIPTFVGPPYHSMPFIEDVDYRNAALFFNVTDHSPWLRTRMKDHLDPKQKANHETEARWWIPDGDISGRAITLNNASDIIERMRTFSAAEAAQKLELMETFRRYFSFFPELTNPPNAVNVLMEGICKRAPLEAVNT